MFFWIAHSLVQGENQNNTQEFIPYTKNLAAGAGELVNCKWWVKNVTENVNIQ